MRNTLRKMDKQGMALKLEKCTFGSHEIEWLGYKITQEGISPLKGKIESIQNQERPKTLKQLNSLLGAAHQLNRFISGLAKICHPFRDILSKGNKYIWTKNHGKAFQQIKSEVQRITSNAHFNNTAPARVTCDASREGLGAVLEQLSGGVWKPIAFAFKFLNHWATLQYGGARTFSGSLECWAFPKLLIW